MPENNNEYNAWNSFRNNDYENFKTNCLHNSRDYGVIRFEDRDVNKELCKTSEFIEIYHKDATRTPCVVIEADTKNPTIVHYLYRDPNFLKKFGSLEELAFFDSSAGSFRDDIINGYRGLDTTYEFCQDFDIRNQLYREIKGKLLSDPFSIEIGSPCITYENDGNIYEEVEIRQYYKSIFRIITKDLHKSHDKNAYIKLLTPPYIKNPRKSDFLPLLLSQSILIYRLIDNLREIQKQWTHRNKQRLWTLRGIQEPNVK